jgi:hypothetical protein
MFAKKEWQEALGEFSELILTQALISCKENYELPPTLPQMLQCCRQIKKRSSLYVLEPGQAASKEIVALHLQKCKDLLAR